MTLWLIGMMGTGKPTVSLAAGVVDIPFFDTDERATGLGRRVARVWDQLGETGFRVSETEVIGRLAGETTIVSTGGGATAYHEMDTSALSVNQVAERVVALWPS